MQRRQFIALLSGVAGASAVARIAHAQTSLPVIGYLHSASAGPFRRFFAAFKAGLKEGGYVEGENVAIESRWAEGQVDRLPGLAADLVRRGVVLIVTGGAEQPVLAAKQATRSIPVVFVMGNDPIRLGVVDSMARPGGNTTGILMHTSALEAKRLGLLHEIIPKARTIAVMIDLNRAIAEVQREEVTAAAAQAGLKLIIINASRAPFDTAFAQMMAQGAQALQICASPFFLGQHRQLVTLAAHHRIPAIYEWRDFTEAGGLMSYGTDLADAYRLSGVYAARILRGDKPADLPVMQTTRFEFVINLATARILGVEIAPTVLARADEVVE